MNDTYPRRVYTILVVDDDEHFRNAYRRLLGMLRLIDSHESFKILEASHGSEALAILQKTPVDCVLLDYQMPGGNGGDWLAAFQKVVPHLPVVMLTGVGNEAVAVRTMREGAADYLVKGNINLEQIERAILNAIHKLEARKLMADAERRRVMIESLGAACHNLGQPMTVIQSCLDLMKTKERSPEMQGMIDTCLVAAAKVADVLHRLQNVTNYHTEPYLARKPESPDRDIIAL